MQITASVIARLERGLAPPDANGCRRWGLYVAPSGYGNIRIAGVTYLTHRVSYTVAHGPIPDGFQVGHLCRVRDCGAAPHLEAVTPAVNTERTMPFRLALTVCKRNHPLSSDNVRVYGGSRFCKQCDRIRGAEYRARLALRKAAN